MGDDVSEFAKQVPLMLRAYVMHRDDWEKLGRGLSGRLFLVGQYEHPNYSELCVVITAEAAVEGRDDMDMLWRGGE